MTIHSFNNNLSPLTSDSQIEARVTTLIGAAHMRQLWLLFLDADDCQLPLVIPIGGLPQSPERKHTRAVMRSVVELMHEMGAVGLVIILERNGPARISPNDSTWARQLANACRAAGVTPRAFLLSHRNGVRWIAPDDYAFRPRGETKRPDDATAR
jgi:hypothetical protein